MAIKDRKTTRQRIHARIRRKLRGTAERPRLAVYFSNQNVYCQLINDDEGKTIVSASTKEKGATSKSNIEAATAIGAAIAERATAKGVSAVVFDRAGFSFHGKVKALADAAREKGLKF